MDNDKNKVLQEDETEDLETVYLEDEELPQELNFDHTENRTPENTFESDFEKILDKIENGDIEIPLDDEFFEDMAEIDEDYDKWLQELPESDPNKEKSDG